MILISSLTANTMLAACIPPSETQYNVARLNLMLIRPEFEHLDVAQQKTKMWHMATPGARR